MSTATLRGSSLWRAGASASSRITASLLSSNGRVAAIGLVSAIATLGFAVWFGVELRRESELGTPMMRSAAIMNTAINQSLAALRGWVAYRDPRALEERDRIWDELIEPMLLRLDELSTASGDRALMTDVAALEKSLRELKLIQWAIEDVAHTPGNEPARVAYQQRLEPLRRSILRGLHGAIEEYSAGEQAEQSFDFMVQLARFRAAFSEGDLALTTLIDDFSEVLEHSARERLALSKILAGEIARELPDRLGGDSRDRVAFILGEFSAYDIQVQQVTALRRSGAWNVAQQLFVQDAQPLVLKARSLAAELAETQATRAVENARLLSRASYAVIAVALLTGLLCGSSLLVSLRLERQVQKVMARAKRLGQYEIDRRIGRGGMGEVYLAHHAMLRRPTAIKLLRSESTQDLRAQRRFQAEVQLTCQLTHPNTIEIFDYGRTPEGIFYYAMELLDGFTLDALVSLGGPVDPARVVHTLVQACGSLQEAHSQGLLHRDIKPSNIMLTLRGGVHDTVKILDFGLVKELTSDSVAEHEERDVIVGTPMYMAPELILSADGGSSQSDLYALGAVGYFMLTGTSVHSGGSVTEILSQQIAEEVPFPSQRLGKPLPESLEYVIMSCLAKDPADRPASAAHLAELLMASDCGSWSVRDAALWWEEFGEAARNEAGVEEGRPSIVRSGLEVEVVVGETRV
jgi:hypothetical protein